MRNPRILDPKAIKKYLKCRSSVVWMNVTVLRFFTSKTSQYDSNYHNFCEVFHESHCKQNFYATLSENVVNDDPLIYNSVGILILRDDVVSNNHVPSMLMVSATNIHGVRSDQHRTFELQK